MRVYPLNKVLLNKSKNTLFKYMLRQNRKDMPLEQCVYQPSVVRQRYQSREGNTGAVWYIIWIVPQAQFRFVLFSGWIVEWFYSIPLRWYKQELLVPHSHFSRISRWALGWEAVWEDWRNYSLYQSSHAFGYSAIQIFTK